MNRSKTTIFALVLATASLAACQVPPRLEDAQYWQRKEAQSALYLTGPKAQQTLHMDISTCVNELSELERVGALREAIPANNTNNGTVNDPATPEGRLARWETPQRDGHMYTEYLPYHDFETCMDAKGWERVESLPYAAAERSRKEYLETVYGYHYNSRFNANQTHEGPVSGTGTRLRENN